MTAVLTYTTLVDNIKQYMERPNDAKLNAQIPTLVSLAENEIASDLKLLGTQQVVLGAFTIGDPVLTKPAYWRDSVSINFTDSSNRKIALRLRTYEFCRAYWPNESEKADPKYYAEYDSGHFLVAPTPGAARALEMIYHARLEPLDEATQQNWISFNAPQLLLYNTMMQAHLWAKNDDKYALWKGRYDEARQSLGSENAQRKTDRTTVVTS
jgi:hypothetical protein